MDRFVEVRFSIRRRNKKKPATIYLCTIPEEDLDFNDLEWSLYHYLDPKFILHTYQKEGEQEMELAPFTEREPTGSLFDLSNFGPPELTESNS